MKSGAAFFGSAGSAQNDDDLMIIGQILAGQKELFRVLVKRYESAVYGMGIGFFHNAEDASDYSQEVFLKIFRSLPQFEGRSRFSTWLYRIAYNTALNRVKEKKNYRSLAEVDAAPDQTRGTVKPIGGFVINGGKFADMDTPERKTLRNAIREAVLEGVKDLPERYRVCVDLFFFYDRSYQEIEMITGYPVNTVKSHVFRAKKLLREKLEHIVEGGIE